MGGKAQHDLSPVRWAWEAGQAPSFVLSSFSVEHSSHSGAWALGWGLAWGLWNETVPRAGTEAREAGL